MSTCYSSPELRHCYHPVFSGTWMGVHMPPQKCCWCGKSPEQEHGPYRPTACANTTSGTHTW
jgi:hypothetical protein